MFETENLILPQQVGFEVVVLSDAQPTDNFTINNRVFLKFKKDAGQPQGIFLFEIGCFLYFFLT